MIAPLPVSLLITFFLQTCVLVAARMIFLKHHFDFSDPFSGTTVSQNFCFCKIHIANPC